MIFDKRDTPGETIKALRETRRLTQADVAGLLGTTVSSISRYEHGSRKMTVERYEEILDILSAGLLIRY